MANYMAEIAKMLGVNICEEFEIKGYPNRYMFINDGMINVESGFMCDGTMWKLLTGEATIKRPPWKPKYDEYYYHIGESGYSYEKKWYSDVMDMLYYKLGNCYRTKEEAEANRDKWVAFYASDEVLEV